MSQQTTRHFPPPWTVEQIAGGYKVVDATGQALAYCYGRETRADADTAHQQDVALVTRACTHKQDRLTLGANVCLAPNSGHVVSLLKTLSQEQRQRT
jgi:hypothetical protein